MQMIRVAIVRTDVGGALAWHPNCLECDWTGKRHDHEETAVAMAKRHRCPPVAPEPPRKAKRGAR